MRQSAVVAGVAALAFAAAACQGDRPAATRPVRTPAVEPTSPPATASPAPHRHHRRPTPAATGTAPAFTSSQSAVTAASLGRSWHRGCPVSPASLTALTMTTWGFDGRAHSGILVVNRSVTAAVVAAFRSMYAARFPVRRMQPIAAYGGSDDKSMAADNTSAFNCRRAVADGPPSWSMHAYGEAIDIDPLENPYRLDGKVLPPAGAPYMNRSDVRRGMIVSGSEPVAAFDAVRWGWGGRWSSTPDYQHFSVNGR